MAWGKKKKEQEREQVQEQDRDDDGVLVDADDSTHTMTDGGDAAIDLAEADAVAPAQDAEGEGGAGDDDSPVDPESVRQMTEIQREQEFAAKKGWHRLGRFFLEVTKPLSDELKLQIGKSQCEAMMEIDRLKQELKAYTSDMKGKIETLQSAAIEAAKKILHGEHVENGHFPAFFDPATKERVYYDMTKAEEVKRIEARREDYQLRLSDIETGEPPVDGAEPTAEIDPQASETEPQPETSTGEWREGADGVQA